MLARRVSSVGVPRLGVVWAILVVFVLAACGQPADDPSPTDASPTTPPETTPDESPDVGDVTIDGPMTFVVNQAPGAGLDLNGRTVAASLEQQFGITVTVENLVEAGGVQGVNRVYEAEPDGSTIGAFLLPRTLQQEILLDTDYDTRELTPIGGFVRGLFALVVRADSPFEDFDDFVEASQQQTLNVGTTGAGSATDLQTARLADVTGAQVERVPFDGAAPARTALMGGHIDAAMLTLDDQLNIDELRILVIPTADRHESFPDAPAVTEYGYDAADVSFYQALFGPPGMDESLRAALESALRETLDDEQSIERFAQVGQELYFLTGEELADLIEEQAEIIEEYRDLLGG
jgi:tripartite-type tricarboxylate transporter receptor subunit TctC